MIQNMLSYEIHIVSFGICELLMIILIINFNKFCKVNMAKKLLIDKKNIIINKLIVISLIIILINFNYTDYGNTAYRILINRICIGFWFYFALFMRMKSIRWVEEEIFYKSNLLNLEYNENINKKIDEYSNLLRMYNHDFKNILVNIKDSIEIGDIVKAKEIISEFDGKIHSLKNYNKKFSNNSLINALLNRLSKECEDKDISFDFDCYIPDDIGITELDLLNIFNNLSSNAYEACSKQYCNEKRWIIFKSYVKDKNFIIYQANSFNGEIKYKKDRLITTKENKRSHGIGVESIKHIVNEVNGMALVKVDKEKREFKFLIKIPDYE
ncbi:sensor histidine kinase [Clostridium perfringens]